MNNRQLFDRIIELVFPYNPKDISPSNRELFKLISELERRLEKKNVL